MADMRSLRTMHSGLPTPLSARICRATLSGQSAGTCLSWATWGSGNWVAIASRSSFFDLHRQIFAKREGMLGMKVLLVSFAVGLFVGVLYGVIRVKSPAPPIVALLGLLGMVLGEQLGSWIFTKNVTVRHAASICLVGKHWEQQTHLQSVAPSEFAQRER